jgi:magnesium chelatase family protein
MSLAIVYTRAQVGIQAPLVTVEVHLSNGLPTMNMVGLPETATREELVLYCVNDILRVTQA